MDIEKYKLLIPNENYRKEKYMKFVEAVLTPVMNQGSLVESMEQAFDIYNAAGDQLDILGELVGIDRYRIGNDGCHHIYLRIRVCKGLHCCQILL